MPNISIMKNLDVNKLIDDLGGTLSVANMLNIKPPSVSEWKQNKKIPRESLIFLAPIAEKMGVSTRKKLLPNDWMRVWPDLIEAA